MASFLSNLFGGGAEREAANRNRALYNAYQGGANSYLDSGLNRSVDAVSDANRNAGGYLDRNFDLYRDMRGRGLDALNGGHANAMDALRQAGGAYDPLVQKYGGATQLYLDSLGVNGGGGNARAVNAFQTGPGYDFAREQGLQALNRRRAAAGMLNSGNADIDAINYGTGVANQEYGNWQNRLQGFVNPELAAVQGRAGVSRDVANLATQDMMARLGLEQAMTQGQTGVNSARAANDLALGNTLAGLYSGDATNRIGVLGNTTSGNAAANTMEAQGQAQGSRNLLNAGMNLASLAAGSFGGGGMLGASGGSFGGAASTLGNLASQYFGNGTGYDLNPWSSGGYFGAGGAGWRR